jgi:serine/threonine-protein kinase HipA
MALRGTHKHYRIAEITRRHLNVAAQQCGIGNNMETIIADVIARTPSVIERVGSNLPLGFPERFFDVVTTELQKAAKLLETMPPG